MDDYVDVINTTPLGCDTRLEPQRIEHLSLECSPQLTVAP